MGLHREKSLSDALKKSSEKLILLEGEPGSGKSVTLRHFARKLAENASKTSNPSNLIPLYINLRGFERQRTQKIDRSLLKEYILQSLNRVNDRDVEDFLEIEFSRGLQENTWLFLFDSFDEIPEILSSTESDRLTVEYASVIEDFMSGMNACRAVIASRQFRGPSQISWPRFRILPLTEQRQQILIKKAELDPEQERLLLGLLPNANDDVQRMSGNPMFLGLLCEYIHEGGGFPQNSHSVFESYITTRLHHDEQRLHNRFKIPVSQVRQTAEIIAFSMTADHEIGLSPTRAALSQAIEKQGWTIKVDFYHILDALEYLKLGKSETSSVVGNERQFSFSHRRFQEYFATCIVLQEPNRVSPKSLLEDARWRETCVTLLQTRSAAINNTVLRRAEKVLKGFLNQLQGWSDNIEETFVWPPNSIYVLRLLQDGLSDQVNTIPDQIRGLIRQILAIPFERGILLDRKLALEVSTLVPDETLTQMILTALKSPSSWLQNIAYKQLGKVRKIVPEVDKAIRRMMLNAVISGDIWRKRDSLYARISRLPKAENYQDLLQELLWSYFVFLFENAVS